MTGGNEIERDTPVMAFFEVHTRIDTHMHMFYINGRLQFITMADLLFIYVYYYVLYSPHPHISVGLSSSMIGPGAPA